MKQERRSPVGNADKELADFQRNHGARLSAVLALIEERQFVDERASEKTGQIARRLRDLVEGIHMQLEGGELSNVQTLALLQAPDILLEARDILHMWYVPYFEKHRGMETTHVRDGINWERVEKSVLKPQEWYSAVGDLHEAAEIFKGRVLGKHVFSTIPGSM